jgi:ParB-like chromosome segregation protein Spo0J
VTNAETIWSGPEELRAHLVRIDSMAPHPHNPRQGDVGALTLSLEQFGQYRLAIVQADSGHLVVGNHLWQAAKALGWTHLAAIYRELTETQAQQLMLADNRIADRGTYDQDALADLLTGLAHVGELSPATGYDLDDLDDLLADLDRTHGPSTPAAPSPRRESPTPPPAPEGSGLGDACPECGRPWDRPEGASS